MKKPVQIALCLGAALPLAACINLGGGKPPASLMRLTPTATVPAQSSRTATAARAVTIAVPTVPQELRSVRVPVTTGATAVAYVKDAQWVEQPNALFARLLSETIAAGGRVVLDAGQFAHDPGIRLTGQLQAFGVDSDRSEAVVRYDAALGRGADAVETRRFEARVPMAAIDAGSVAPALNQAANQVAADVAQWIGN
jgi:cholesterol transport system auxiliary component